MKRKKLWIIILSVVAGIVFIFGGGFMLTKLSNVSVEFRTRLSENETRLEYGILDKVKQDAEFDYNKSVLFLNIDKNISNIEKSNPYVKVEQVIRKFPNKVCVYISERVPVFRLKDSVVSTKWYILDSEFKVLSVASSEELETKNLKDTTIELEYLSKKLYVGDFAKIDEKEYLNEILKGIYGVTRDYFVAKSIDYDLENKTFDITMKQRVNDDFVGGCILRVVGLNDLTEKTREAVSCFASGNTDPLVDLSKKVIIISNGGEAIIRNQE